MDLLQRYATQAGAARACGDLCFGLGVGERLDLVSWLPFVDAVSRAATLGELLARFIRAARDEATSARHGLVVEPVHSYFRETRTTIQEIAPARTTHSPPPTCSACCAGVQADAGTRNSSA